MRLLAITGVLLGLVGCGRLPPAEMYASLFHSQAQWLTNQGYVCLQMEGNDVEATLIGVLGNPDGRLVPGSACTHVMDVDKGSFHTATGTPAYFFDVHDFVPLSAETAQVRITIYHHGLWAIHKTFEMHRSGEQWVIVKELEHVEA